MTVLGFNARAQSPTIQSEKHSFQVVTLTKGLENPWSMAFLPGGRMIVTERAGRMRLLDQNFKLDPKPIEGFPEVVARGQGGLFDVVLHPDFANNGWIYWSYNASGPGGWGIRLHDDGRIPADNPLASKSDAKSEKWTWGHRNIQGAAFHPKTGELWTHEHGPQGGDEINITRSGRNYGWPVITHGVNYGLGSKIGEGKAKTGLEQPSYVWVPSIAPSGMSFVSGARFPSWQGDLLIGALRDQSLVRLKLDGEKVVLEERLLKGQVGLVSDVRMGPDGLIYLLSDASDGALMRLEPDNP